METKKRNKHTSNRRVGQQHDRNYDSHRRKISEAERIKRKKKRRRKRLIKKLITVILLFFVAFCGVGMVYLGRDVILKEMEEFIEQESQEGWTGYDENEELKESVEPTVTPVPTATPLPTATPVPEKITVGDVTFDGGYKVTATETTIYPDENQVTSANSILIDLSTDTIVASRNSDMIIYPASMTKILTVLVAAEHVTNLDDTFTVTGEMTNYCLSNGCSAAGFWDGEVVKVRDLFYGTILPSGGEAAVALATYVAGSHEAFVDLMNQKVVELGLGDTAHFTNCVGIFDENNYCTVTDMAMILKAALANDWAREVLSTKVHTTEITPQNPEGIVLSNWFLRRIEDKDCGGTVIAAKTGYVVESGNCAASYAVSASGIPYICVTVNAQSDWRCIYDHVAMYKLYAS